MTTLAIALVGLAIWLVLLLGRGGFWRARERDDDLPERPAAATLPAVVAVVPARDEAAVIAHSITSLLAQDYPGPFRILLVDDGSSDGTARLARKAAEAAGRTDRLEILPGSPLPAGWAGKVWAMAQGVARLREGGAPTYILFTDADIAHAPDVVRRLVGAAEARRLVLVSLMAKLNLASAAERWLVPAFVFFFQMLYPFAWVNDPRRRIAAAAGGCMLVRESALETAGGIAAIRSALIDDCALGAALKRQGPVWLGLTDRATSLRPYPRVDDIRRMVLRSAYAELRNSPARLAGAVLGMAVTYLAPVVLTLFASGPAQLVAALTWLLMILAYGPMLRFYGLSPWRGLALPAIALAYMAFTVESALAHMRGRGGAWKGRFQAAPGRSADPAGST